MRTILAALVAVVLGGACGGGGEAPAAPPVDVVPALDPNGAALVQGDWSMPDGAGCVFVAGFGPAEGHIAGDVAGGVGRYCSPPGGYGQWSRELGSYEVRMTDVPDPDEVPGVVRTLSRRILITVKSPTCAALGDVLAFDAQITGNSMILVGADGARSLTKGTFVSPDVTSFDFGCFAADGSFTVPSPIAR